MPASFLNPTATSISSKSVMYVSVGFITGTTYLAFWVSVESTTITFFFMVVKIFATFSIKSVLSYVPINPTFFILVSFLYFVVFVVFVVLAAAAASADSPSKYSCLVDIEFVMLSSIFVSKLV